MYSMENYANHKSPMHQIPIYFFFICDSSRFMGIPTGNSVIKRIDIINYVVPDIIEKIGKLLDHHSTFKGFIRVLTYEEKAEWQNIDNICPSSYIWKELHAYGKSNLGAAFIRLAKALRLREHRGLMRTDGPIPILVLVLGTDPDDNWKKGLEQLNAQYWGEHAIRFAVSFDISNQEVITCFLGMNDNHYYSLFINQIDELPSRVLAVLKQRNVSSDTIRDKSKTKNERD